MSFGNFEHFEGVNSSGQFDKLGEKEDLGFLSNNSREQDLTESSNSDIINNKINEVKVKIADLNEAIRTKNEDEKKLPMEFLKTQDFELKDAQAELAVLEAKAHEFTEKKLKNKNFKEDLINKSFLN